MGLSPKAPVPFFSTNLAWAMKVWDVLRKKGVRWLLSVDDQGYHLRHVACVRHDMVPDEKVYTVDRPLGTAKRIEDLPRVICEAALKEVDRKLKEGVKVGIKAESEGHDPGVIGRKNRS